MKTWLDATREDVLQDLAPGVTSTNVDMINKLNWTSWLMHIGDLINMDSNQFEMIVREHFESVILCINGERTRAETGEYPDDDQVDAYMASDAAKQTIEQLTRVTVSLTKESWPVFRDKICQEVGLDPKDFHFEFEDQ